MATKAEVLAELNEQWERARKTYEDPESDGIAAANASGLMWGYAHSMDLIDGMESDDDEDTE